MITRTVIARCDRPDCGRAEVLDPHSPQSYHTLSDLGWQTDTFVDDEILTFCPDHKFLTDNPGQ